MSDSVKKERELLCLIYSSCNSLYILFFLSDVVI